MPFLSIIIPAFNEADRLPETLVLIQHFLSSQSYTAEVIVVDDASTDNTVELAEGFKKAFPALRIITNTKNKGKGGVVKQGLLEAKGDYCLFTDADNSTPIQEVVKLLACVPEFEVVIGSRYLHPESIKVKQPLKRQILSRASNLLIQFLLVPGIKDTQCGFKLFSKKAVQDIFPKQEMSGWSFDFELLAIARHLGYAIKEVPVDWFDSRSSTLRASRAAYQSLKDLWSINRRLRHMNYEDVKGNSK